MQDTARFIAEAKAAGASVQQLERNVASAGTTFQRSTRHGFWFNQLMFTMRRQVYGTTLALGTLGAGAALMGFKFDIGMDAARMAFERFLGGPQAAQKEIDYLFDLAALTPFEFPQLADATRKFLAFGYSVDEANSTLEALADGVAAFGLGADAIDRGVLALGQMRSAGRVLGQDLRQLQELGLFSPEDFQRRLNLPAGFLGHVGELGIPSKAGIDAITAYWRDKFGGASEDFSKTFMGRITTLRDYAGRAFGSMVRPLKDRLTNEIFPQWIDIAKKAGEAFETGGMAGFFAAIDEGIGKGTNLAAIWTYLASMSTMLLDSVRILTTSFWKAWTALKANIIVFGGLYIVMWSIYQVLQLLEPILPYIIALWIAERLAIIAVTGATKVKVLWDIIETAWIRRKTWAETIYLLWLYRGTAGIWARVTAARAVTIAMLFYTTSLAPAIAATWAFAAALWATGIPEIIIGITLLIGALYVLAFHFDWVKQKVVDLWNWFGKLDNRGGKLGETLHYLSYTIPGYGAFKLGRDIFRKFQFGGTMPWPGGMALVGEGGPEVLHLPGGASVTPIDAYQGTPMTARGAEEVVIPVKVYLDGRQVGEAIARRRLDAKARS